MTAEMQRLTRKYRGRKESDVRVNRRLSEESDFSKISPQTKALRYPLCFCDRVL